MGTAIFQEIVMTIRNIIGEGEEYDKLFRECSAPLVSQDMLAANDEEFTDDAKVDDKSSSNLDGIEIAVWRSGSSGNVKYSLEL